MNNWVQDNSKKTSVDMLKELLNLKDKLLLVHFHKLERIKLKGNDSPKYISFVEKQYDHYITQNKTKQDLWN